MGLSPRPAELGQGDSPAPGVLGSRLLSHARFTWGILAVSAAAAVLNGVLSLLVLGTPGELVWIAAIATPVLVGAVIVRRRPGHPLAGFFVLVSLSSVSQLAETLMVVAGTDRPATVVALLLLSQVCAVMSTLGMAVVLGLYASGVVQRRYERVLLSAMWVLVLVPPVVLLSVGQVVLPFYFDAQPFDNPWQLSPVALAPAAGSAVVDQAFLPPLLVGLVLLLVRYRRSNGSDRRPMRWLLLPVFVTLVAAATQLLIGSGEPRWLISLLWLLSAVSLVVSVGLGLLQPAGVDVDRVLRQSLVYALLWLAIAAGYVGLGAAVGVAAGQRLPVGWAVTATIVAALAFQPARAWLERLADQWVFGSRPDPSEAVARLGATLAGTYDLDTLLPVIETTVRDGLNLEWVRVRLEPNAHPAADDTDTPSSAFDTPILLDRQQVGVIACGPAVSGRVTDADRALVATFAHQAALAVRNVRLTRELAAQTEQLAQSRARLVRAQDAERRRIERNIHDGVQQELVALIGLAGQARREAARHPAVATEDLQHLQNGLQRVLRELRELAQGIHPSVLTDRGLLTAVETLAARHPVPVTVRADPDLRDLRLPEDVEGAGYFTVAESLANSLKHAAARQVDVSLRRVNGSLVVAVRDNGTGIPPTGPEGNGLAGLAARVAAAGGRLDITGGPGQGTTVAATLSVPDGAA